MGTTEYGYEYELSWDYNRQEDVIYVDLGDYEIYFTKSDLQIFLQELGNE